jgi:hypothetical protein
LILASLGVALALASLAWQAFSFRISGSRITTEIQAGLKGFMGGQLGVATLPPTAAPHEVELLRSQGFTEPVLAVRVVNTGRGSTSVASVDLLFDDGGAVGNTTHDPPLPFRLIGESEQSWYFDASFAVAYVSTMEQVKPTGKPHAVRGRVRLGSKRVVISESSLPIP